MNVKEPKEQTISRTIETIEVNLIKPIYKDGKLCEAELGVHLLIGNYPSDEQVMKAMHKRLQDKTILAKSIARESKLYEMPLSDFIHYCNKTEEN